MYREPEKLKVFRLADELAASALRLAILEGCAAWKDEDFARHLAMARSGAAEMRYLLGLGRRVGLLAPEAQAIEDAASRLVKGLQLLLKAQREQSAKRRPKAV